MQKREIEINRNIIERFLMIVRNLIKENKKKVLISLISVIIISSLIIAGFVFYEKKENMDLAEFEQILNNYRASNNNKKDKSVEELHKTIDDLNRVIDSSLWGYVNEKGYYIIANIYLSLNMHKEAKEYLLKFVDRSPSSFFASLALHRAGIACEQLEKYDEAFKIYQRLERDYEESVIADEIYYDLGRIYQIKGEIFKAREYYNKVISLHPRSVFASKAKKRLLLIGYLEKKDKSKKLAM